MWFNSFSFLWFFPLVLLAYYAVPSWRGRKILLLAASYFFYACWNPPFVLLLILSSLIDYTVGRALCRTGSQPVGKTGSQPVGKTGSQSVDGTGGRVEHPSYMRKLLVTVSCTTNFGILAVFKYSAFLIGSTGLPLPGWVTHVVLPVGISFYTFHGVSYIFDVYRGRIEAERSPIDFMLFVAFFPQLVAGPILRAWYFVPQLHSKRRNEPVDWLRGAFLIILGLFQKIALADNLAPLANYVFDDWAHFNTAELWLGTYAFAFQIYFDFAGYSNIAIGCARLLGFEIPENFRLPYIAAGFREFWRRWHISLSTWLRDYLYIPLGGSRRGQIFTIRNLMITMALGGLWHGANWTFVIWGLLHGVYLTVEHLLQPLLARIPVAVRESRLGRAVAAVITFHLVCIGWVFFRARTVTAAASMVHEMLLPTSLLINFSSYAMPYVVIGALCVLVGLLVSGRGVAQRLPVWAWGLAAAALFVLTLVSWGDASEFIYFRF